MDKLTAQRKQVITRELRRLLFVAVFFVLAIISLFAYCKYDSNRANTVALGTDSELYHFMYNIPQRWKEKSHGYAYGMQYDLEIQNRTTSVMYNWVMELTLVDGCYIDSSWNGEYTLDGNKLTVTSLDYNDTVDVSELQPFGFILYGPVEDCLIEGNFIYYDETHLRDLPLFWLFVISFSAFVIYELTATYFSLHQIRLEERQQASLRIINQSFLAFSNTIDAKDNYTKGHSLRVATYARELARRMDKDEDFQQNIFYVGLLHDIGKIGVQDAILKKNARLTYDEYNEVKEHVSMGGDILKNFTAIPGIEDGARYHHERFDGSGYMEGLRGEEIPLLARIIAVADAFDAMSSSRCYRPTLEMEDIIRELRQNSGTQFDPQIVPIMVRMINEGFAPIHVEQGQLEQELSITQR